MAPTLFHKPRKALNKGKEPATQSQPQPAKPATPGQQAQSSSQQQSPKKANRPPRPKPAPVVDDDDDVFPAPQGEYRDFKLMSSTLDNWKYDIMKFDSRKPVELPNWHRPVKLNRKELRRGQEVQTRDAPVAVGPMLGPDGKPVIGADGRVVQVDADGRPIHNLPPVPPEREKSKSRKFQKKTRQVFLVPEATRQLRREERYPWVMEDGTGTETWVGSMEEAAKADNFALFMPTSGDVFKFVPAHRWYKFQKRPHYKIPNLEEAETLMAQIQKNKDPERWLIAKRNGQGPSDATAAIFKAEAEGSTIATDGSLVRSAGQSLGPGGRRLRAVDSGANDLFSDGEDDDEGGNRRQKKREKEYGGEGDMDELDFEDTFADDEENANPDEQDDEEMKELEERLKKEYKQANKTREGYIDESDHEDDEDSLTREGKAMKKFLRKNEGDAYDSDEEKNPYASSEEEEEEEPPEVPTGPAIQQQDASRSGSQPPRADGQPNAPRSGSAPNSRATSPVPAAAGHGGHSVVAKRATSPKSNKVGKPGAGPNGSSRATSPLAAGAGSRATSPTASSRAGSPVAQAQSPGGLVKPNNKRKAEEASSPGAGPASPTSTAPPKLKKRKGPPVGELSDQMVIDWLRTTPNPKTRDCIAYFTKYLTDDAKKSHFTSLVKEVAQLKDSVLVLRPAYQLASPPATP